MITYEEAQEIGERRLCHHCIGEEFLRQEVESSGDIKSCDYCGETSNSLSIAELCERVEVAFDQHFYRTPDYPSGYELSMFIALGSSSGWEREGAPVEVAIMDAANIPEKTAVDVAALLEHSHYDFEAAKSGEESEFSAGACYEEKSANPDLWHEEWRHFENILKTESRYFSGPASGILANVFDGIEAMRAHDGRPLITEAGPDTALPEIFRARSFQSDATLAEALARPDLHLGPPPSRSAVAGRMNAHGISVCYGANDPNVALAEVRPPVGSRVAIARFRITRRVMLLDLTALRHVMNTGSVFDSSFLDLSERTTFLQKLSERITVPVMPDDVAVDYLPTQAIADFLATERTPTIDGIVYSSVQGTDSQLNVVLFHKSSRVEAIDLPQGTELETSLGSDSDDGWEDDYTVYERVAKPAAETRNSPKDTDDWPYSATLTEPSEEDLRETTLQIDLDSVRIHKIESVRFTTNSLPVSRHRYVRRDFKF